MDYGVIFDMDGVLVDSYRPHFESWRMLAAEEGIELTEAQFAKSFGRTSREIIRSTWVGQEVSDERVLALDARKESHFRQLIDGAFPAMPGAGKLVRELHGAGIRLAVGSSAPPENVGLILDHLGRSCFEAVVNGMDVKRGKPDPQVFLLAAERAGLRPERCVVIEDAAPGVEAAKRAGMAAVAFVSTGRTAEEFAPLDPDLVIRSLDELNADVLKAIIDREGLRLKA